MADQSLSLRELYEAWAALSTEERLEGFTLLSRGEAEELFSELEARDRAELLLGLPESRRRGWMRFLAPDDAADVIQEAPDEQRAALLELLDIPTRGEVIALLAYAEDAAGGLMNPRYARLRPDMTTDEAITYLRRQTAQSAENIHYGYVLDAEQRLLGVVSLRQLFGARPDKRVREIMRTDVVTVPEQMDQEEVSHLIAQHDLVALPVVDGDGRMKGIVTVDDIVDVVQEEATEDMHKIGGTEALEAPYLQVGLIEMLKKRAGWLVLLLVGESLTVKTMHVFEDQIAQALVLALFIPLIVSSGGNSGSQGATLVVRAMALGEVRLQDWWRVVRRELLTGLGLGITLGTLGFVMALFWHSVSSGFGPYFLIVAVAVALSIMSVVVWGTLVGSMLPFLLRRCGFDPASASSPLVATLMDASGLVIYFSIATLVLHGTVL